MGRQAEKHIAPESLAPTIGLIFKCCPGPPLAAILVMCGFSILLAVWDDVGTFLFSTSVQQPTQQLI